MFKSSEHNRFPVLIGMLKMKDFCQVKKLVKLHVSPAMLRSWADGMERQWPHLAAGESIVWRDIFVDENTELQICYDQGRMHRDYPNV